MKPFRPNTKGGMWDRVRATMPAQSTLSPPSHIHDPAKVALRKAMWRERNPRRTTLAYRREMEALEASGRFGEDKDDALRAALRIMEEGRRPSAKAGTPGLSPVGDPNPSPNK